MCFSVIINPWQCAWRIVSLRVTQMLCFVCTKNLPFPVEEMKKICSSCMVCTELKPKCFHPDKGIFIKTTHPIEHLSINFISSLPSASHNASILPVVDEYSWFPFAFLWQITNTTIVIKCFNKLFALTGLHSYIHSKQGASFLSKEMKTFFLNRVLFIGNGQFERYNGII